MDFCHKRKIVLYKEDFILHRESFVDVIFWVLLNRAHTSTQLYPPQSTSTQLISASTLLQHPQQWVLLNRALNSTQLNPPPPNLFQTPPSSIYIHPAHFSLHPALCNTLNNIRTKISHVIGQFP